MFHPILNSSRLLEAVNGAFVWQEHMSKVVATALLSMVPTFEGRYAVVTSIAMGVPAGFAYCLAFVASSIPMPFILLLLRPIIDWFYTLPIKPVQRFAAWLERRSTRKREKMNADQRTGLMSWLGKHLSADALELVALYLFVALPLPGTGVWTGSAVATLFEMPRVKSGVVILLGNATACLITMLATTGVIHIFG